MRRATRIAFCACRLAVMCLPLVLIAGMVLGVAHGQHRRHGPRETTTPSKLASIQAARRVVSRLSRQKQVAALEGLYCFDCHNLLTRSPATSVIQFSHLNHLDRGFHCNHCHGDLGEEKHGVVPMATCLGCHDGATAPGRCTLCHADPSHAMPTTHGEGWLASHGELGQNDTACLGCHREETCQTCHTSRRPASHGNNWVQVHNRFASQQRDRCKRCHRDDFCGTCHRGARPASHKRRDFVDLHGKLARKNLRGCTTCHSRQFCTKCHGVPMPHPAGFLWQHGKLAKKNTALCGRCHEPAVCFGCHGPGIDMPHPPGWKMKAHSAAAPKTPAACANCHEPKDCTKCHDADNSPESHWEDDFSKAHGNQAKGNEGLCALCHGKDACNTCHGPGIEMPHPQGWKMKAHSAAAPETPAACANCHEPEDCAKCHDADNSPESHWEDDFSKAHGNQAKGNEGLCALCHGKSGCADCHEEEGVTIPVPS